jgi:stearoyl-CoA 9-desaturase NADPH oxidoreductase
MNRTAPAMVERARRPLEALLRTRLVGALASPRTIDDYLEVADPAWSVREVRARIVAVQEEGAGATSLFLRPNGVWRGFRAGQYVQLAVSSEGVRVARCFSLSSAPEDPGPLRLTIKLAPGGAVSRWLRTEARIGDVVALTQAMGNFVLPDPPPPRMLFISGGSGITPVLSIVRHLAATEHAGSIHWLHFARRDVILGSERTALVARCKRLRLETVLTDGPLSSRTHFSRKQLERFAPGWAASQAFLCGPASLMEAVTAVWATAGLETRLRSERFVARTSDLDTTSDVDGTKRHRIVFARSGRVIEGRSDVSLLEQAEGAGLKPMHGCRIGVCRTCSVRKRSGAVRNAKSGAISDAVDEDIQLCISTPRSDVTLDL